MVYLGRRPLDEGQIILFFIEKISFHQSNNAAIDATASKIKTLYAFRNVLQRNTISKTLKINQR